MTAQIPEKLHYDGKAHAMCTQPLDDYLEWSGAEPGFDKNCSALWRGYVGTWSIDEGRLYLVGLSAMLESGCQADLETLFPGFPRRVFAHWYSGEIRLPQGRELEYVHMGYASTFERDLFIRIEKGVVVSTRVQHNGEAGKDAPEGYGVAAMTVKPSRRRNGGAS